MNAAANGTVDRDAGLAIERTSLSWNRTALALLVNGVLAVVHHEGALPLPVGLTLLVASLFVAAAVSAYAAVRGRHARHSRPRATPDTWAVLGLGAALTVLSLGTALTVAVSIVT